MIQAKLSLREKLCYGCGDFASCLFWGAFSNFLFLFYTDVFGIGALAVGGLLFFSRIWDGINDPILGMIADRTKTRWGKFRPYLLWMCVPFAIMGTLLFTTPNLGPTGKLIWAYVTYNGMMMIYTAINIPYTALLGVITPDSAERTRVASIKFIFAFAANLAIQAVLLLMVKFFGGDANPQLGWQLSFAVIGITSTIFFLITFAGTKERVTPPAQQKTTVLRDLGDLFTNHPWLILVATTVTWILFVATRSTITAHYIKYYVGAQTLQLWWDAAPRVYDYEYILSVFLPLSSIGSIAGIFFVGWFAPKVGKKTAFISLFVSAIVFTAAFYWLKPDQLTAMFVLQFLGSFTGGPLCVILWAMYADTADFNEWKRSRRATGLVFSASTMTQKFGWAIAGVVVGYMLNITGFIPNVDQAPSVLHGLVLLMSIIPSVLGVVSIVIFCFYPLNEKKVGQIESDLNERRLAAGEPTPA